MDLRLAPLRARHLGLRRRARGRRDLRERTATPKAATARGRRVTIKNLSSLRAFQASFGGDHRFGERRIDRSHE